MTLNDPIIVSRSSEKPICKMKTKALVQNNTLFAINIAPRGPYLKGLTRNGPIFKSQAKCSACGAY